MAISHFLLSFIIIIVITVKIAGMMMYGTKSYFNETVIDLSCEKKDDTSSIARQVFFKTKLINSESNGIPPSAILIRPKSITRDISGVKIILVSGDIREISPKKSHRNTEIAMVEDMVIMNDTAMRISTLW